MRKNCSSKKPPRDVCRCSQQVRDIPLERFKLPGDGRKWRSAARHRYTLYLRLSTHANADGTFLSADGEINYSPSIKRLEKHFARRTLYRHLNDLQELGLLPWRREQNHYGRRIYEIRLPDGNGEGNSVENADRDSQKQVPHSQEQVPQLRTPSVSPSSSASVAAPDRPSQDTRSAPSETVENAEQLFKVEWEKLLKSKGLALPSRGRPSDPLGAQIWDGMYSDRIRKAFFDMNRREFSRLEQLAECLSEAVNTVTERRKRMLMHLPDDVIMEAAWKKLRVWVDVLAPLRDEKFREDQTLLAVRHAVVDTIADMLESGKKKPPARPPDHGARAEHKNGAAA